MGCSRRALTIGSAFSILGYFLPVMRGQGFLNSSEVVIFSTLQANVSKIVNVGDKQLSSAYFSFNSKQHQLFLRYLGRVFVTYNIPEGNNVTITGKIA